MPQHALLHITALSQFFPRMMQHGWEYARTYSSLPWTPLFVVLSYAMASIPLCRGMLNTASFFKSACLGMLHCMLRHACYCQFLIFVHAMASNPLCLGMFFTFSYFNCFESFSSPFDSNARIIICKIKYHVKMSKMIIMLTKLLSIKT